MVNKSPLLHRNLETCLRVAPAGDPILLYEDGVYAAMPKGAAVEQTQAALAKHPVYALSADLKIRGVNEVLPGVQIVDYDGFVALVEQHDVVPWL
jgi:tRNA 2-thiouridine synthesizing protein B